MNDRRANDESQGTSPSDELSDQQKLAAIVSLPTLLVAGLAAWLISSTLDQAEKISAIVGGIGTLILSLVGTVAGLWWFLRRQPLVPRLNVEQEVTVLPGPKDMHLLQVFARLENVGELPVKIRGWRIWVCPLDPLPRSVSEALLSKSACVDKELRWEHCAGRRIENECFDEIRVRAGEIQETIASVLVERNVRTVRIHSFFPHPHLNEADEDRGWTRYSIVQLEGEVMPENERTPRENLDRTSTRTEVYREPVRQEREPPVRKDENYREPRPQSGNQESGKG